MQASRQLLIWTSVIFVLSLVLLNKLRDNTVTANLYDNEAQPELAQIELANLLKSDPLSFREKLGEASQYENQLTETKAEKFGRQPRVPLYRPNISTGSMKVYHVRKGDTLWKISKVHNLDLRTLISFNRLKTPNLIRPGQAIKIPSRWDILHRLQKKDIH